MADVCNWHSSSLIGPGDKFRAHQQCVLMEEVVIVRDNYCIPRVTDAEENQWFSCIFHRYEIFSNIAEYFLFLICRSAGFQKV